MVTKPFTIYLAGPMDHGAEAGGESRGEVAWWRRQVMDRIKDVRWAIPEAVGCDHKGVDPVATLNGDLQMIHEADALFAYLDRVDRTGTILEIGYAVALPIPVLAVVEESTAIWADIDTPGRHGSGHICNCMWPHRLHTPLWFPLAASSAWKYVNGREEAVNGLVQQWWSLMTALKSKHVH